MLCLVAFSVLVNGISIVICKFINNLFLALQLLLFHEQMCSVDYYFIPKFTMLLTCIPMLLLWSKDAHALKEKHNLGSKDEPKKAKSFPLFPWGYKYPRIPWSLPLLVTSKNCNLCKVPMRCPLFLSPITLNINRLNTLIYRIFPTKLSRFLKKSLSILHSLNS